MLGVGFEGRQLVQRNGEAGSRKVLPPRPFYIASRVEGAIALTTVTISAMGKDDGEI